VIPPGAWSGHSTDVRALLAEARKQSASYGALALRVDPLTSERAAPLALAALGLRRCAHGVQPAATAVVDLGPSEKDLWHGLARDARYRIHRAQRDGVVVREGAEDDVISLAAMLAETGRRKGFGVRGAAYLRALTAMLRSEHSGTLIVAELDGAIVGATVVATFGQRAASLYTASDARGRRVGAQHLLHWAAMLRAKEDRCALYDFRGVSASGAPTDNWEGLDFFKQRFGTRREELAGAWDHVYRPLAYQAFLLALEARQRVPRLLTPVLSRLHQ
jgi:lipid II:glycine glycyltransferase (peptidoglycan interpeptide bridge formation enzyme)